jgi:hypothetical protein
MAIGVDTFFGILVELFSEDGLEKETAGSAPGVCEFYQTGA